MVPRKSLGQMTWLSACISACDTSGLGGKEMKRQEMITGARGAQRRT